MIGDTRDFPAKANKLKSRFQSFFDLLRQLFNSEVIVFGEFLSNEGFQLAGCIVHRKVALTNRCMFVIVSNVAMDIKLDARSRFEELKRTSVRWK